MRSCHVALTCPGLLGSSDPPGFQAWATVSCPHTELKNHLLESSCAEVRIGAGQ